MEFTIYTLSQLMGIYREQEEPSTYFRDLAFGSTMTFDTEFVDFQKIREGRKLAPLVIPTAQGRPIYEQQSELFRVKPAYVKPKDPVSPERVMRKLPTEALLGNENRSPAQRWALLVADILRYHRKAIDRREEWMAAQALIHGRVTLEALDYPTTIVDFKRDPTHTVTLTGAATWDNADVDVMAVIQTWIDKVRRAPFGGPTNRLTVGAEVLPYILENESVRKQLDLYTRGTNANVNTGLRSGEYVEYIGKLGPNLELWVNSDFYEQEDGSAVPFLDPKGALLTGPNVDGVRCYGAILDKRAGLRAMPIFPKMWDQEDPSVTHIMTQSAPLPTPVNPNNSHYATVLPE